MSVSRYGKRSKERRSSPAFILSLAAAFFLIPDGSQASDIYGVVRGRGQPNTPVSYKQPTAYPPANTMQQSGSGFSIGQMMQPRQESFTRPIKTRIETTPRASGGSLPDLIHPEGKLTELQEEAVENWQEAQIKTIPARSGRPQPDLGRPKNGLTRPQQEVLEQQPEDRIKKIPRTSGGSLPDLIHPEGELTELQKEAAAMWREAEIKAIPERRNRPRPDVDCTQAGKSLEKSLQRLWDQKRSKKKAARRLSKSQGQDGNGQAPLMSASRKNGVALRGKTKTTGGKISREKNPIQVELCDAGREEQIRIKLQSELTTKVKPKSYPWLDDYCGIGRYERLRAMLRRESETKVQWSKNREQPGWCGNERPEKLKALRWKWENNQTFEQPLEWIRAARERNMALRDLCSGGRCPHPMKSAGDKGADTQLGDSFFQTKIWADEVQKTKKVVEKIPEKMIEKAVDSGGKAATVGLALTPGPDELVAGYAIAKFSKHIAKAGKWAWRGLVKLIKKTPKSSLAPKAVRTPYGLAEQATSKAALAARSQVKSGVTLYRIGTTGRSNTTGAQFWALEHPSTPGFAARYGIPPENVANANFIQTATLRPGSNFVTRVAPAVGKNPGGGIEVVVEESGVIMGSFVMP